MPNMLTVAYLAIQFPSEVEPYVGEEIEELRKRGVRVIAGSVRKARADGDEIRMPEILLQPVGLALLIKATWLAVRRWRRLSGLIFRIVCGGREGPWARIKALLHTYLGACYAVLLAGQEVDHIHAHHGYFGSWIAMTAARLLGAGFSMTLHGSDLLLHGAYLDVKLENCSFCLTISEYNRRYILERYPQIDPNKILVSRLGVELPRTTVLPSPGYREQELSLLAVGRLHAVKDHAFLIRACAQLQARGLQFECSMAGEGPERGKLESLIGKLGLERRVTLLGHIPRECMDSLYERADVVVLTSRSEGIPLVLMEAMARGKIVLAPAITGIPELVIDGKTGFLYQPGSMGDFLARLLFIHSLLQTSRGCESQSPAAGRQLDWVRHAAQVQVRHNYNRKKNLQAFTELFVERIVPQIESSHEDFVLQQIQLPVQRHRSLPV
jgi:colanic acid/amylovoran biosynthesis glycosyltransferase